MPTPRRCCRAALVFLLPLPPPPPPVLPAPSGISCCEFVPFFAVQEQEPNLDRTSTKFDEKKVGFSSMPSFCTKKHDKQREEREKVHQILSEQIVGFCLLIFRISSR